MPRWPFKATSSPGFTGQLLCTGARPQGWNHPGGVLPPCWGQKAVSMGRGQGQRGLQEVGDGQKGLVEGAHGLRRGRAGGELWIRMVVVPGAAQGCTSPLGEALPVSLSEVLGIYQRKALGSEKPTKY